MSQKSDTNGSTASDSGNYSAPSKKVRKQKTDNFKLGECTDVHKTKCNVCLKQICAGKNDLYKTIQHCICKMNQRSADSKGSEEQGPAHSTRDDASDIINNVKEAEIRICLDIIEHNRSFNSLRHIEELCKSAMFDSEIANGLSLTPTKICEIIKNVIDKAIILRTAEVLKDKYFSVIIDESMDISGVKTLCILIRYVHEGQIKTDLLDLVAVRDTTAETLYKCLLYALNEFQLARDNMIGVCVENVSTMLGDSNLSLSRVSESTEDIAYFPCTYHCMNLVTYYATNALPDEIEDLFYDICSYFTRNTKRQATIREIQVFMNAETDKILEPSTTSWLALTACVKKVLEQWTVLFDLFANANKEGKETRARTIFKTMNNPLTKAYLEFLGFILPLFDTFHIHFQSNSTLIHCLLPESVRFLCLLGHNFLKQSCFQNDIRLIDVDDEKNLLPLDSIDIGMEAQNIMEQIKNTEGAKKIKKFYVNVQTFYKTAFKESIKRLAVNEKLLDTLQFLNPKKALDIMKNQKISLDHLFDKYRTIFRSTRIIAKREWKILPVYFLQEEKEELLSLDIGKFWQRISTVKNIEGQLQFKNISNLAILCLSLPLSNADVKQYLSTIALTKTKLKNKLKTKTVRAITRIRLDLKNEQKHCYNYEITPKMLELFNSDTHKEQVLVELNGVVLPDETDVSDLSDSE